MTRAGDGQLSYKRQAHAIWSSCLRGIGAVAAAECYSEIGVVRQQRAANAQCIKVDRSRPHALVAQSRCRLSYKIRASGCGSMGKGLGSAKNSFEKWTIDSRRSARHRSGHQVGGKLDIDDVTLPAVPPFTYRPVFDYHDIRIFYSAVILWLSRRETFRAVITPHNSLLVA